MNKPCLDFRTASAKQGKATRAHSKTCKPVSRETGEMVTMRNCTSRECRWGYGLPRADMVLCGREAVQRGPWCEEHRAAVYLPLKTVARQ